MEAISNETTTTLHEQHQSHPNKAAPKNKPVKENPETNPQEKTDIEREKEINAHIQDIIEVSKTFNKHLKFSINKDLNQVIVKVIDSNTDKVIRVIPSEEIQRLHTRLRETIGLIFDERI